MKSVCTELKLKDKLPKDPKVNKELLMGFGLDSKFIDSVKTIGDLWKNYSELRNRVAHFFLKDDSAPLNFSHGPTYYQYSLAGAILLYPWLKSLPEEELRLGNEKEAEQTGKDYKIFVEYFKKGHCSLCKKPLKTFSAGTPCLHWLLRPKKFKKKHFPLLYEKFTYFRISAYVRWVASIEAPLKNINDIVADHPGDKIIDFTVKYKHITWSFSCGKSDLEGHKDKKYGVSPHYHLQMTLNRNRFISYNDFHIPFHSDDLYDLELFLNHSDIVRHRYGQGAGMHEILGNKKMLELLVDESEATDNPDEAAIHLSTMIMAKEGETFSGKLLIEAFEEAKATGKTATSILRKKLKDTEVGITTIVSPGDGVPVPQQRKGRRKNKN